jgi:hypothetical protein
MINETLDLTGVQSDTGGRQPVPAGEYKFKIAAVEKKTPKSGQGAYLKVELDIAEGEHAGRKVFHNLNVWHPNTQPREIALAQLKGLLEACRYAKVDTPALNELPGLQFFGTVTVRKDPQWGDQNDLKSWTAEPKVSDVTTEGTTAF